MDYVAGVDGGGTGTRCWLATRDGTLLARGEAGPANFQVVGPLKARQAVEEALRSAAAGCGFPVPELRCLCVGMAGVDRPDDLETMERVLRQTGWTNHIVLDNDATIALAAGTQGGPGIVVVAGTGSIAYGVDPKGKRARSGGWGYLLGDEGSAYDMGRQALIAVLRYHDGRGPDTMVREQLVKQLGLERVEQIVSRLYGGHVVKADIAALAPLVSRAAAAGDVVAEGICTGAARELAIAVRAVADRLDFGSDGNRLQVVTSGGVFREAPGFNERFARALGDAVPTAAITPLVKDPAVGAVFLGLQAAGVQLDAQIVARVEGSYARWYDAQPAVG